MSEPRKYRNLAEVEAMQWDGDEETTRAILVWMRSHKEYPSRLWPIVSIERETAAEPGDWIISDARCTFHHCKPDIFEQTYEAVTEGAA